MLLTKVQGGWAPPSLTNYGDEYHLQGLLAESTELIPGAAGSAAVREFPIPKVGQVDILCVDAQGAITLVECKLAKNSEIRRTVVGQIFAYASGLRGMSAETFEASFAASTGSSLLDAVQAAAGSEVDAELLREGIARSLDAGAFRLVLAVDEITPELTAIVEYLHAHLNSDVPLLALQVGYLKAASGEEFLLTQNYGAELAAEKAAEEAADRPRTSRSQAARPRWTIADLTEAIAAMTDPVERDLVEGMWEHAQRHEATVKGGVGPQPSAGFYYPVSGKRPSLWSFWADGPTATVAINLGSVTNASSTSGGALLAAMRGVPVLDAALPADDAALRKYPTYAVAKLAADLDIDALTAVLDVVLGPGSP